LQVIANTFHQVPHLRFKHGDKLSLCVTGVLPIGGHFSRFPCNMLFFSFLDEITSDTLKSSGKSVADVRHGFSRTRQINRFPAFGFGDRHVLAAGCRGSGLPRYSSLLRIARSLVRRCSGRSTIFPACP
jgi:hypothetical protein